MKRRAAHRTLVAKTWVEVLSKLAALSELDDSFARPITNVMDRTETPR
jgi:hypothetical protein